MLFTSVSKILASLNAKTVDGTYFPNSMALMVCLLTLANRANSAWVMFFLARSTLILFFMGHGFIQFLDLPVEPDDKKQQDRKHIENHYPEKGHSVNK